MVHFHSNSFIYFRFCWLLILLFAGEKKNENNTARCSSFLFNAFSTDWTSPQTRLHILLQQRVSYSQTNFSVSALCVCVCVCDGHEKRKQDPSQFAVRILQTGTKKGKWTVNDAQHFYSHGARHGHGRNARARGTWNKNVINFVFHLALRALVCIFHKIVFLHSHPNVCVHCSHSRRWFSIFASLSSAAHDKLSLTILLFSFFVFVLLLHVYAIPSNRGIF